MKTQNIRGACQSPMLLDVDPVSADDSARAAVNRFIGAHLVFERCTIPLNVRR